MKRFRKKKLINSQLQLKLVAVFLFISCVASLFQVVLLNRSILRLTERFPGESGTFLEELRPLLFQNLMFTLGVLVPAMLFFGILVTHRIAGPIYRFERHLESIIRGESPGRCIIRKGDELQSLCDRINDAVDSLKRDSDESGPEADEAPSEAA